MAPLVELRVVWNPDFRHQAQDTAVLDGCRHIVELIVILPRKSHKNQHIASGSKGRKSLQLPLYSRQKRLLDKQIPAGVGSQTELREYHDFGLLFPSLSDQPADLLPVKLHIGYLYLRSGRSHP